MYNITDELDLSPMLSPHRSALHYLALAFCCSRPAWHFAHWLGLAKDYSADGDGDVGGYTRTDSICSCVKARLVLVHIDVLIVCMRP